MKHPASQTQLSVGILYGLAEGSWTGRRLRKSLRQAGFTTTAPARADIIIAHSGGYLVFPRTIRATTIVYVGANTWDQPLASSLRQKLRYDFTDYNQRGRMLMWLLHGLRNDMYILHLPHTFRLARGYRARLSQPPTSAQTIIIKNRHDPYCTEQSLLRWANVATYVSTTGGHDDIWNNPAPYVDVIQSLQRG